MSGHRLGWEKYQGVPGKHAAAGWVGRAVCEEQLAVSQALKIPSCQKRNWVWGEVEGAMRTGWEVWLFFKQFLKPD